MRGRSTPYGASTPYSAFAQLVKQTATIFDSDEPEDARAKLVASVAGLAGPAAAEEHAPSSSSCSDSATSAPSPSARRSSSRTRVFVESLAMTTPTLLLFEDIHWADASQLDLLEMLAARVRDVPVLLVALARPELLTERPDLLRWAARAHQPPARSAERGSSKELAEQLLSAKAVENGAAAVVEMAEGNPLFIEELTSSIAERSSSDKLPTSVRAIIAARLDSLPLDERSVVDASVAGRVFWRGALAEMGGHDDLATSLSSLEDRA